jgi:polysaccharide biosynthesis protein PslE
MSGQHLLELFGVMKRGLRRRRALALWIGGGLFALTLLLAALLPSQYESQLKLLVKNERVNSLVSQDQQTQGIVYVDEVGEGRVNTEVELLTSADLLRRVAEHAHLTGSGVSVGHTESSREERAAERLRRDLVVEPIRKSSVISVRYRAKTARQAAEVLRTLATEYMAAHVRLHGSPGAVDAFESLAARYTEELQEAQAQYEDVRRTLHIGSLAEDKALAEQKLGDLQKRLTESNVEAARTGRELDRLEALVSQQPKTVQKETRVLPNQAATQQLILLLTNLENKKAELTSRYLESDRVIQDVTTQITQTRLALQEAERNNAEESTIEANPVRRGVESDLLHAETENAGAVSEQQEVARELALQQERVASIDAASPRLQELSRKINQLAEIRDSYSKKAYEAQVGELLDRERIANVAVLDAPVEPVKAIAPHRLLIVAVGCAWSLLAGVGVAFLAELLAPRVSTAYQLQQLLGAPVLGVLEPPVFPPRFGPTISEVYDSVQLSKAGSWRLT